MDTKLTKPIGEHRVCSELARLGWATALTRDGLARTDILAVGTKLPGRPTIEVQVKSATQQQSGEPVSWMTGKAVESRDESGREWFVLVVVPPTPLHGYVIPRDHLSAAVFLSHQDWLTTPSPQWARNAGLKDGAPAQPVAGRFSGPLGPARAANVGVPGPAAGRPHRVDRRPAGGIAPRASRGATVIVRPRARRNHRAQSTTESAAHDRLNPCR